MRQGDTANALYLVVSGRFAVTIDGHEGVFAEVNAGQPIGEIAFLTGGTRTATVRALRDSLVLRLARGEFDRLAERFPSIWLSVAVTLARRLIKARATGSTNPHPRPRTITIIRAGEGPLPLRFLDVFASVVCRGQRTRIVASRDMRDLLPSGVAIETIAATKIINELETKSDCVVFVADPDLTEWSSKAIRQADLVLAVGAFDSDPSLNVLERCAADLLRPEARRLVLTHANRRRVVNTRRWLSTRSVLMHHHVALDGSSDVERLCRFIAGTARGFVAGGRGAFCAALVGVYAALLDANIPIDVMAGTSAAGGFAAAFALGSTPEEIVRATHETFVVEKALGRYTWPRYSILDHKRFDRALVRFFGGYDIEDLWIPYFTVSANLSTNERHFHRSGELWTAIRATTSLPVALPPVYTGDGHMLVDGSLLDGLPIAAMHQMKAGPNVVVSLHVPRPRRCTVAYSALPSRADLLRHMIDPLRRRKLPQAPDPITVLMQSLDSRVGDFERELEPGDLLLTPPLPSEMGFRDWHRQAEAVDAAYHWSKKQIAQQKPYAHCALAKTTGLAKDPDSPQLS